MKLKRTIPYGTVFIAEYEMERRGDPELSYRVLLGEWDQHAIHPGQFGSLQSAKSWYDLRRVVRQPKIPAKLS